MSEHHERVLYPFSAIVGQERMKTALMLNELKCERAKAPRENLGSFVNL